MLTEREREWLAAMLRLARAEGGPYTAAVLSRPELVALLEKLGIDRESVDHGYD